MKKYVGPLKDLARKAEIEQALAESERRFHSILETVNLIAIVLDVRGDIVFCNDFLLKVTGWNRNEVMGRSWIELFIPEDLNTDITRLYGHSIQTGNFPSHHENPVQTREGESRIVSWNNTVLRDIGGNITGIACIGEDITDRRQAEAGLRESEERFRQLAENIREVFWLTDVKKNRIIYVSPAYREIWGCDREELLRTPRSFLDAILPEDRHLVYDSFVRQGKGESVEIEYRISRPDGSLRWIRSRGFPVLDKNGAVYRIAGVSEDITEKITVEEALRNTQQLLLSILDHAPAAMYVTTTEGRYSLVNPAWEQIVKISRENAIGRTIEEIHSAASARQFKKINEEVLKNAAPVVGEEVLERADGRRFFHTAKFPVFGDDGQVTAVGGISLDITERKKLEETLRESEGRYRGLFEHSPVSLWELDYSGVKSLIDGLRESGVGDFTAYFRDKPSAVKECFSAVKVVGVNKATLTLYEAGEKDDLFNNRAVLYTDEALAAFREILRCVASGTTYFETETVNRTLTKRTIHVKLQWTVAPGHEQTYAKTYIVMSDITKRKEAEERLMAMSAELSRVEEKERRRIAADLHDHIGQNLALSKIKLSALKDEAASSGTSQALDEICGLIDQSIRYSRSLTFELGLPILYDLGLEAALEWLAEHMREKHGLAVSMEIRGPLAGFDEETRLLLFKAVRELLLNVVKHAGTMRARVDAAKNDGKVGILVEDSGVGFSLHDQAASGKGGFGLFSVRERLKHAGGVLRIDSLPGQGTRASITMPVPDDCRAGGPGYDD